MAKNDGSTPISREDREGLIPDFLTTREELNAVESANINQAALKYFGGRLSEKKAPFTYEWLLRLHREMFGEVWKWAGEIRRKEISIGIPVHQIRGELVRLVGDYNFWNNKKEKALEVSAWIHHRLVWIHPFRNGNGRWARFATDIYLKRSGLSRISWPEEEIIIRGTFRKEYIAALQEADRGDFTKLIALHRKLTVSV